MPGGLAGHFLIRCRAANGKGRLARQFSAGSRHKSPETRVGKFWAKSRARHIKTVSTNNTRRFIAQR